MTKQNNAVTPEFKSCINNLISTVVLPSAATVPESMALINGFLGFSRKNFTKRLEESKVNAWIDSMRAASPTRVKSSENQEKCSWIVSIYRKNHFFFFCNIYKI